MRILHLIRKDSAFSTSQYIQTRHAGIPVAFWEQWECGLHRTCAVLSKSTAQHGVDSPRKIYGAVEKKYEESVLASHLGFRHGRKFCVSDIRQNQEFHMMHVHDWGLFPLSASIPAGRDGMRAGTA